MPYRWLRHTLGAGLFALAGCGAPDEVVCADWSACEGLDESICLDELSWIREGAFDCRRAYRVYVRCMARDGECLDGTYSGPVICDDQRLQLAWCGAL